MHSEAHVVHRATPQRVQDLGEMLDTVYRPRLRPGDGMPKEFPHLFNAENARNLYYVEDDGKPVSLIAVYPQHVVFQGVTMEVASIGSVVTVPEARGQKISSAILDKIIGDLTDAGVPLMLVSGDRDLYRRIHCVPVGTMFEAEFTDVLAATMRPQFADDAKFRVLEVPEDERSQWAARLTPIYRAEPSRYRRTDGEMATLVNALWSQRDNYEQRLFVAFEGEEITGYTVAYRSLAAPLSADVFEWAGSRQAFMQTLTAITDVFGAKTIRFHVHCEDKTMLSMLQRLGVSFQPATLQGTVRVLDVQAFFSALNPIFIERFGAPAEVGQEGIIWNVKIGEHQIRTEHLEELVTFVFNHGDGQLGIPFVHTDDLNYI